MYGLEVGKIGGLNLEAIKFNKNFFKEFKDIRIVGFYIAFFLYFLYFDSFELTLPLFIKYIKMDVSLLGLIFATSKLFRSLLVVPISNLANKNKLKFLICVFILNIFLLFLVIIKPTKLNIFVFALVLLSTTSIFNVILNPKLGSIVPKNKVGITFGFRDVFLYAGGFLGLIISAFIKSKYSFDGIFIFYIILFVLLIGVLIFLELKFKNTYNEENSIKKEKSFYLKFDITVFKNQDFLNFLISNSLLTMGLTCMAYVPLKASQIGIEEKNIYYLFSSSMIISSILSILGGILVDKFNKKRLIILDAIISLFIISCFLSSNKSFFILGIILIGLGSLFDNTVNAYLFNTFADEFLNKNWGIISFCNLISSSLSIYIFACIYKYNSDFVFILALILTSLGIASSKRLR